MNGENCIWCEKSMGNSGHTYDGQPCHMKCEDSCMRDGLNLKRLKDKCQKHRKDAEVGK
jgi:hypothetical protein